MKGFGLRNPLKGKQHVDRDRNECGGGGRGHKREFAARNVVIRECSLYAQDDNDTYTGEYGGGCSGDGRYGAKVWPLEHSENGMLRLNHQCVCVWGGGGGD